MKKHRSLWFAILLASGMLAAFSFFILVQYIDFSDITGMSPMRIGKAIVKFKPPPPTANKGGTSYPCPAPQRYVRDGHQAGLLITYYDPARMKNAEAAITVIDSEPFDQLHVVFVDENCNKIKDVNLGEEAKDKIFTFKPETYIDQPSALLMQSVRDTRTVENPLVGKVYDDKTLARNFFTIQLPEVMHGELYDRFNSADCLRLIKRFFAETAENTIGIKDYKSGTPRVMPQSVFATVGSIQEYSDGTVEEWLELTNVGDTPDIFNVKYYNGDTCQQKAKNIALNSKESATIKVSDMSGNLLPTQGAFVITSGGKKDFIVEKYGVVAGSTPRTVYKLNALSPNKSPYEKRYKSLFHDASRKFLFLTPTISGDEQFKLKVINLPALENLERITEDLVLQVTDGKNNWRTFTVPKSGCVITIDQKDLQEWAYKQTWKTKPDYLAIYGTWRDGGAVYPTDTLNMPTPSIATPANEPGFEIGESFGNCCGPSDCASRWGLGGWACGHDDSFGDGVCLPPEETHKQAQPAPPVGYEFPSPPPPPELPELPVPLFPSTSVPFPTWIAIVAAVIILLISVLLFHKKEHHP